MKKDTITYIQKLLKEDQVINKEFFMGFFEDANIEDSIDKIRLNNEKIIDFINELEINETPFKGDPFEDIESFDISEIEDCYQYDYVGVLTENLEENFNHLEYLLEENEIEIPEELIKEKDEIINFFKIDFKLEQEINKDYEVLNTLNNISKDIESAQKEKDSLDAKIEELEDEEKDLEYLNDRKEEYDDPEEFETDFENKEKEIEEINEEIINMKSDLYNYYHTVSWDLESIKRELSKNSYLDILESKIEEYQNNILGELIYKLGEKNPDLIKNDAAKFIESNNSVSSFLKNKEENNINEEIKLSQNEEIQELKIFNDNSVVVKRQEGWEKLTESKYSYFRGSVDIAKSLINHKLRKKPKYKEFFKKAFFKDNNLETTLDTIDYFFKLEQVLKNKKIDITVLKNEKSEFVYDKLMNIEKEHKIENYAKSLLSNKYKHFITPKSLELFEEIIDAGLSKSHLQNHIGRKLASFKTQEYFEDGLKNYLNLINEFELKIVKEKSKQLNVDIILEKENLLILKVNDYNTSNILGKGTNWCISRNESLFNTYVKHENNNQYFIYDFSKDSKNPECMIGVTIKKDGGHRAAHLKNDRSINEIDVYDYKKLILENDNNLKETLSNDIKRKFEIKIEEEKIKKMKISR
jgi:hypothetical protein